MRLGLRLTLRQNGNKPADGKPGDDSAANQGEDETTVSQAAGQPGDDPAQELHAGGEAAESPAPDPRAEDRPLPDDQTIDLPAVPLPEDVPAVSHEEYVTPGSPEDGVAGAAQDDLGAPPADDGLADAGPAWDRSAGTLAEDPVAGGYAGAALGAAAAGAGSAVAEPAESGSAAAEPAESGSAAAEPAAAGSADAGPAGDGTAGDGTAGDGTAGDGPVGDGAEAGAAPAGAQTMVLTGIPPQQTPPGLGQRTSRLWQRTRRLWQRTVGRAWQHSIARLGISRLWQPGPGVREAADPGGRALALITVMPVILLVAWLVPGLLLLLVHEFLPAPMVLIWLPLAVALTILVARELPGRWPSPGSADTAGSTDTAAAEGAAAPDSSDAAAQAVGAQPAPRTGAKNRRPAWAAWWGLLGTVAIAVAFAVWQLIENSPQFIVSRDPGAYAQFAYWIANHGSLPVPTSTAAFGGAHPGLTFASFGFASHGGALAPGLTAGLPIVLAVGMWVHGVSGAIALSPLIGALAILTVGGLTARLAGPQWAPAGALLLALTVPEIYTSRSAFADTLAQALLFGGLCLVVDSFSARRRLTLASLGGLALGLTVLAGTSFLLMILPLIVVAGALLAGRRPQAIPLAAGSVVGVICGFGAGLGLDLPALSTTSPSLRIIGILAAGLALLTGAGAAIALVEPARRRARKLLAARPLRWLPEAGEALVVLAAIGLAIRPYVQQVRGPASPYIAALQRLEGLPVDPGRLYAENSLYWVIWYLGVPALLLGLAGLAMVTRMCLRALIKWRDPTGMARSWALPAAIIGWGVFAVLWLPATVPDQPWASRQLVPVVLPGLIVLAVWVAAWLIGRAHARGAGRVAVALATACFVIAMAVPTAAITFGIALSRPANPATRVALSGLAFRTTGAGEVSAVAQLCGAIPRHSSVVLLDEAAARAFAEVIRGTCGVPTGIVTGSAPGNAAAAIGGIERAGRHPVLLATKAQELAAYGAPRQIVDLTTQQDEHLLTKPPTSTWPVRYTLWMSQPGGTAFGA